MKNTHEAQQRLLGNNPRMDTRIAQLLAEQGTAAHPDGGLIWKWDSQVDQVFDTFSCEENETRFGWIHCPVLLLTAQHAIEYWEQQNLIPQGMQALHDAEVERRRGLFADARHHSLTGAGHMIHYDQPRQLNRTLRKFVAAL